MTTRDIKQENVEKWFDKTYKQRGELYLRPVKAYYIFLELLDIHADTRILDVACGLGRLLEAAKDYSCDLYGIDLSSVAVEKAKLKLPGATIKQANAEDLPFEDNYFEYVTCLGSLERMLDKDRVLAEIQRVTKPNAKCCFLVRNADSFSWKYVKKKLGLRNKEGNQGARNLESWTSLFTSNGFKVDQVLHDQYPLQKRKKLLSLGFKTIDYKKLTPTNKDINEANEFLFILSKS